jgi:hypothetical protein
MQIGRHLPPDQRRKQKTKCSGFDALEICGSRRTSLEVAACKIIHIFQSTRPELNSCFVIVAVHTKYETESQHLVIFYMCFSIFSSSLVSLPYIFFFARFVSFLPMEFTRTMR